jgi:hypothetical protein
MWIIRVPEEDEFDSESEIKSAGAGPKSLVLTIEPRYHIPCSQNVLLVYRGYSDFGVDHKRIPLVAAVCSQGGDEKDVTSVRVVVDGRIATVVLKYGKMGSVAKFHFKMVLSREIEEERTAESSGIKEVDKALLGGTVNVSKLYEGPAQSVLSRFGLSLHVDQKNIWIFGGYSLSHGPLNDIRHFSRESNSWVPLTITVVQNDEAVPPPRYFHGGVVAPNQEIFIHGGISVNLTFLAGTLWPLLVLLIKFVRFY